MMFPENQIFKVAMYFSSTAGIWPLIFEKHPTLKLCYMTYHMILRSEFFVFILRAYFQLVCLIGEDDLNVQEIFGNLCITLIYTVAILRLRALNRPAVVELFNHVIAEENNILSHNDAIVVALYKKAVRKAHILNKLFLFNGWLITLFYFIHPLLTEDRVIVVNNATTYIKLLPLSTWWPFDAQKHYTVAYVWNVIDGIVGSQFVTNTDILTFTLIIYASGRIEILGQKFKNFSVYVKRLRYEGRVFCAEKAAETALKTLIFEHLQIIRYIDIFNEAMKYIMLFDFLQCSIQMATIILQLLVMEITFVNVIIVGQFFLTMIIRLVIYYYNANEIIHLSQNWAVDIWWSDWYDQTINIQRMMAVMILRVQKPLKLLIGPFSAMSLETFIAILKATYSYMMLFNNTSG
ncbi:odorant receptor 30a-like [Cylas formicarius]|uniref:odorant receptor 30a-like n=1 Tax=Cylas formicarius TaxID=197179 RepID=UPI002958CD98|nr:odorant receptor 30a-like [Cylas formicarius]